MEKAKIIILFALVLIITFAAFSPCLKNGFVNWDDDLYVANNAVIQDFSPRGAKQIFTSYFISNYQPLVILSYLFEHRIFKLNPFGYHLTNLILHLFNCLLVFWLIYILTGEVFVSFLTGFLFGIHPLHVESVAWISERKDVLYAFFFLASIICYCYYSRGKKIGKYYYLSLILFILSLLSKAMAITLPVILVLIDYFLRKKRDKGLFIDKIPFFILSFIFGVIALFGQYSTGAVRDESLFNFLNKIGISSYSIIFYLNKILMPVKLSCLYPYSGIKNIPLLSFCFITSIILLTAVIFSGKYTRKIIFGSAFFLIAIMPVLQFIPIGETVVADRYVYVSSLGIFYLISEGFFWVYSRRIKYSYLLRKLILVILIAAASTLILLTRARCQVWKDSVVLWNDVLKNYPDVATAYNSRGAEYLAKKEYANAYVDFISALSIDKSYYEAYFNLGSLYRVKGNYNEAIKLINKTLQINPGYLKAYDMLADIYGLTGRHSEVINVCNTAIQIKNDHLQGYINLCSAYGNLGNLQESIACGVKAVAINSKSALAHMNLSTAYFYAKKYDLAIKHSDMAVALGYEACPRFLEELKKASVNQG